MNEQNNEQLNNETGHVAKRFFSDAFNGTEDVSVSSAQIGNETDNINGLSNSMEEELEVLDIDMPDINNDGLNTSNTVPEPVNSMPAADPNLSVQNSPIFQATLPENNVQTPVSHVEPTVPIDQPGAINNELANNQPLSAAALGVSTISEDKHNEVVDQGKFFTAANADTHANEIEMIDLPEPKVGSIINDVPKGKYDVVRLSKDYIGEDYAKFKGSPFNFGAFLFGSLYFAYRNMLLFGIIVFLIEIFLVFVIKSIYAILAVVAFRLILALMFNFIYLNVVKFRVKQMMKAKNATEDQVSVKCQRKPKTNSAFLLIMLAIIIFFGVGFTVTKAGTNLNDIKEYYKNVYLENFGNIKNKVKEQEKKETEFDGTFKVTDYDVSNILDINPPSVFVDNTIDYGTKYVYTTNESGTYNQCLFTVRELSKYSDVEEFMDLMAKYYEKKITDASYNGIDWYSISVTNKEGTTYYSAAMIKERPIIFQYLSGADTLSGECNKYYIQMLESLKIKES